jgi:hypothetical protein
VRPDRILERFSLDLNATLDLRPTLPLGRLLVYVPRGPREVLGTHPMPCQKQIFRLPTSKPPPWRGTFIMTLRDSLQRLNRPDSLEPHPASDHGESAGWSRDYVHTYTRCASRCSASPVDTECNISFDARHRSSQYVNEERLCVHQTASALTSPSSIRAVTFPDRRRTCLS